MTDAATGPDLTRRETYRRWTTVTIRYGDQDSMGHVNNAVYATWFEAARVPLIYDAIEGQPDLDTVLARLIIDYRRETHYPGEVEVGARLLSLGNKSLLTGYGVFRGDACYATAECVNVFFDTRRRHSVTPPHAVRATLVAELAEFAPIGG